MRIRSVKPEYFTNPSVTQYSIPARLLLVSLWNQADDEGRLRDLPRQITGNAFGENDDVDVGVLLDELAAGEPVAIWRYVISGERLIQVRNFRKHQRIDHSRDSILARPPWPYDEGSDQGVRDLRELPTNVPGSFVEASRKEVEVEVEQGTGSREQGAGMLAPRKKSARPARVRPVDPAWEAFVEVTSVDDRELTAKRRKGLNGMLASLVQAVQRSHGDQFSRPEIARVIGDRAAEARNRWPDIPLTPEMLTRRFAELGQPFTRGPSSTADRMAAQLAREGANR